MELRDAQQSASDELKRTDEGEAESPAHREQLENESTAVRTEGPNHSSLDFGTKRIQMLELRRLRNGEVREPFKPFRYDWFFSSKYYILYKTICLFYSNAKTCDEIKLNTLMKIR